MRRVGTLALLFVFATLAAPVAAEPIAVGFTPIRLDAGDLALSRLGPLKYLTGGSLGSRDNRFGGLSGLLVEGDQLIAVSDRGFWFRAHLMLDEDGTLAGLNETQLAPILSSKGVPLAIVRGEHDAEAIERWGSVFAVGFERFHRIGLYDPALGDTARPTYVREIPGLAKSPSNGGIEVLVALGDDRLLVVTEELENADGDLAGWIIAGDRRDPISYPKSEWKPTDAAYHPDVGLLFLERKFSALTGFSVRIRHVNLASVEAGGTIKGPVVARISGSAISDNFEGLAISTSATGQPIVWMVSDDNFSFFQQTLLLAFQWVPTE